MTMPASRSSITRPSALFLAAMAAAACDPQFEVHNAWAPDPTLPILSKPAHWLSATPNLDEVLLGYNSTSTGNSTLSCMDAAGNYLGSATLPAPWKWGATDRHPDPSGSGEGPFWAYASTAAPGTIFPGVAVLLELNAQCQATDLVVVDVPHESGPGLGRGLAVDPEGRVYLGLSKDIENPYAYLNELWMFDPSTDTWDRADDTPPFSGPVVLYGTGPRSDDVNYDPGLDEIVAGIGVLQRRYQPGTMTTLGTRQLEASANFPRPSGWDVWWGYTVATREKKNPYFTFIVWDALYLYGTDGIAMESNDDFWEIRGVDLAAEHVDVDPPYLPFMVYGRSKSRSNEWLPYEVRLVANPE